MSKRERAKRLCECGCNQWFHHSKLVAVSIEQATDISLRETKTAKRFFVGRPCEEAFTEELGLLVLLDQLLRAWAPHPKTWVERLNVFRTMWTYWRRIGAARRVLRMTHVIYERTKGFEYAHDRAMRSAILFGCPRFMQGCLARRFLIRAKRKQALAQTAPDPIGP